MPDKIFFVLFVMLFCLSSSYASEIKKADDIIIDYKDTLYPRDNNSSLIENKDLFQTLDKKSDVKSIFVSDYEIMGNRIVSKSVIQEILLPYKNKFLSMKELNTAASAITSYYRREGYIVSYAYIPQQVVSNDIAVINIVEGEIGDVIIEGVSERKKNNLRSYFDSLHSGLIFNYDSLERILLLLNSYMDIEVRAELKPGKKFASSDIYIYVKENKFYKFSASFDNYGTDETAQYRFNAGASLSSLLRVGDKLSLNFSMGLDRFSPTDLLQGRADYKIPISNEGVAVGATYTRGDYNSTGDFRIIDLKGTSNEYALYVEYPILLRTNATLNILGRVSRKDSFDKMLGHVNTADGIYTLSAVAFGEAFLWQGSAFYYWLGFNQGLNPIFNGSDFSYGSSRPEAGGWFEKADLDIAYYQNITNFFRINAFLSAQLASEAMFASNKFYLGGMYSVRGFENSLNSGDNGVRFSLEGEFNTMIVKGLRALVFFDSGYTHNIKFDPTFGYNDAAMASVGVGVRYDPFKYLSVSVEYGLPVYASREKLTYGIIYARVGCEF